MLVSEAVGDKKYEWQWNLEAAFRIQRQHESGAAVSAPTSAAGDRAERRTRGLLVIGDKRNGLSGDQLPLPNDEENRQVTDVTLEKLDKEKSDESKTDNEVNEI